jgi:GNAT superfamily N-acetyltransferase
MRERDGLWEHSWSVVENPKAEDVRELRKRLGEYNIKRAQIDGGQTLAVFARSERGELLAGVFGWLWGECMEIDYLWVHDSLRGRGLGRRLMESLEQAAMERGCMRVVLDTFSFQGPGFYEKLGYCVFGVIKGYGVGHHKIFLEKQLKGNG